MSKVNVIVPCYNGAKYLDRFFKSLLNQSYKDFDVFFVDDGSTDNTKEVVEKYIKIFKNNNFILNYFLKENGGASSAINVAFKQNLTGKYLMIMDCDDELTADSLELRVDFLKNNPEYGAVTSYYNFIDNESNKKLFLKKSLGISDNKKKTFENIIIGNEIVFAGYMFDKDKLFNVLKNKQIYESKQGQNWQLLLPISYNFKIGKVKKVLYNVYVIQSSHSHSVGKTREKLMNRLNGMVDILENVLTEMGVLEDYKSYIEEYKCRYFVNMAYTIRDKKLMLENYKKYRKFGKFDLKLFIKYNLIKFGIKK